MQRLVQGNEATFQGAVRAGASFYSGYPISPSSEIMAEAAKYSASHPEFRFIQTEDEIAAAMSVLGASLAGAKAFTATSGPGFSLMQESLGMGYMSEIPCVFVDVQRVGPSTGMPTLIAQGDLLQVQHGSHGDYYSIAFYPNSVAECYTLVGTAFNVAEEARQPVILLSDAHVGHLYELVDLEALATGVEVLPRALAPLGGHTRHFTGLISDDNGVPRTSDYQVYRRWLAKVKERSAAVAAKHPLYEYRPNPRSATLLISFGIISRTVLPLTEQYGYFRPIRMLPVLAEELREVAKDYRNLVVVEANDGQYASLVEQALKRDVARVPVLGGKVSPAEIADRLAEVIGQA
ncbi:MAG: 2-oxoacid:acceptor oxidoreductase subunit alpha [Chloroflexi bacterium]|nr:2-oxoacid:acceptor oxidoreductase subunit alpha [Chloroflexota bacterium]MCL5107836.1 2-oxoacid:acceptor oxidoreductase subunit alpha [Chloroflexota bacterium]